MADHHVTAGHHDAHDPAHGDEHHSFGVVKYVIVGVVLAIITGIEVAIFYLPSLAGVLVPILLTLSAVKFFVVVLFFMHLKFDDAVFSRVFYGPLFLAVLVVMGMIVLFKILPKYGVFS
jgi:cytochrome c oxidase subunit IV